MPTLQIIAINFQVSKIFLQYQNSCTIFKKRLEMYCLRLHLRRPFITTSTRLLVPSWSFIWCLYWMFTPSVRSFLLIIGKFIPTRKNRLVTCTVSLMSKVVHIHYICYLFDHILKRSRIFTCDFCKKRFLSSIFDQNSKILKIVTCKSTLRL